MMSTLPPRVDSASTTPRLTLTLTLMGGSTDQIYCVTLESYQLKVARVALSGRGAKLTHTAPTLQSNNHRLTAAPGPGAWNEHRS